MFDENQMHVIKRNGSREEVSFDKISCRLRKLSENINPKLENIRYAELVMKIINQLYDNIPTSNIDELVAEQCASQSSVHLDYGVLASRLVISNHHKNTSNSFYDTSSTLYNNMVDGKHKPILSTELWDFIQKYKQQIENDIDYSRDFNLDYFGFKTLERAYLMRQNKVIVERPQDMWMRVALSIHINDYRAAIETYNLMSMGYFTHATPTLFNAGTLRPQLSSCYLLQMEDDSIDGIFNTLKECAQISKWAGGIGLHIHNIRGEGQTINGTNGISNGIVPMLKVFNSTARYVDQGGGKRNGSIAIYMEPWHSDIYSFLDLKKNHGDEEMRARDLFYALWIPDLFMEAVKSDTDWYLFSEDIAKGLSAVYGSEFKSLYDKYVLEEKYCKKVKARELWFRILDSQMETGVPYLLYKDSANKKSNQQNLGTIRSSNLCTEIIEYSDETQSAVCNLASIGLPKFIQDGSFDYDKLHQVVKIITKNLNNVIDLNYYPTKKTEISNMLHRPIGIGVQGLADVFAILKIGFDSDKAKQINRYIFETIYHGALESSWELSKQRAKDIEICMEYQKSGINVEIDNVDSQDTLDSQYNTDNPIKIIDGLQNKYNVDRKYVSTYGRYYDAVNRVKPIYAELEAYKNGAPPGAYSSFMGSPMQDGLFQFDLWNVNPTSRYDWNLLRENIVKDGIRNSLLIAPMPTASTSQILGNNECFEPFTSNIYSRRTLAGEFMIVNKHLIRDLTELGLWNMDIKNNIIANHGSIQQIQGIPDKLKEVYKIVWEIPMKSIIDMAADRGVYICQSQSMNLWVEEPDYNILTSMHFYSWKKGLKTGQYYLRRKPRHQPQQFTINPEQSEICESCSA